MSSQKVPGSVFLLVLASGSLIIVSGMHWFGLAIVIVASVIYGVFLGKSGQIGTTK